MSFMEKIKNKNKKIKRMFSQANARSRVRRCDPMRSALSDGSDFNTAIDKGNGGDAEEKSNISSNKHVNVTSATTPVGKAALVTEDSNFYPSAEQNHKHDIEIVAPKYPSLSKGFCDRLTITFEASEEEKARLVHFFKESHRDKRKGYSVTKRRTGDRDLYRERYEVNLLGDSSEFLLLFEIRPWFKGISYARLDFSGRSFRPEFVKVVDSFLNESLGAGYKSTVDKANVTRFDASVDIFDAGNNLLFVTNRARNMTTWIRRGGVGKELWEIETLCYGSEKSDYQIMIYDKGVERWNTKFDNSMLGVKRVEVKFEERKNGRCLTVCDFKRLTNPFSPLCIGRFPDCSEKDKCDFFFFLNSVERYGADGMLQLIKDRRRRSLYRMRLESEPFSWWRPSEVWQEVLAQLKETGIFPSGAFD